MVGHSAIFPLAMTWAKTSNAVKRDASNAREASLQCALAAYQEGLASDEVLYVHKAAQCFNVPKTSLQECINEWRSILESNAKRSQLNNTEIAIISLYFPIFPATL